VHGLLGLVIALCVSLLVFFVPAESFPSMSYGNLVTYVDQSNGLSIQYPENWEKIVNVEGQIKTAVFVSPSDDDSDEFFENLVIVTGPAYDTTLEDGFDGFIQGLAPNIPNFKILESDNVIISGIPAFKISYKGGVDNNTSSLMAELVFTISNNQFIAVNFVAEPTYPDYASLSQEIFDSVQIDTSLIPKMLTGKYWNQDVGVEVELPKQWLSIESQVKAKEEGMGQMTLVMSINPAYLQSKSPEDFVVIGIFLTKIDQLSTDKILSSMENADCQPVKNEVTIMEVNKMKAFEFEMKCDSPDLGRSINVISHGFITQKNIVYTMYGAGSDKAYEDGIEDFRKFENSLKIKNTLDISDPYSANGILGTKVVKEMVKVGTDNYEVIIGSDSAINDFSFDRDASEISFKVSGKPYTMGSAGIYPETILNPPYTVAIDGKIVDNVLIIHDTTNDNDSISFSYKYPVGRIVVSGGPSQQLTSVELTTPQIPGWIKNNAKWWSEGSINDDDFTKGIQFLIKEGVMKIPKTESSSMQPGQKIPDWIKNNAKWWSDGQISDDDFVKGVQYLVEHGIVKV